MIRAVAMGQTRFVVPGLVADGAGVVSGPEAVALVPTLGHLVGFLRSISHDQPILGALGRLEIQRARMRPGGPVVLARFRSRGINALDRAAALLRLHQGQLFTGGAPHAVRYRDAGAGLGYDAERLVDDAELVLYDRAAARTIEAPRAVPFDGLVRQLSLSRLQGKEAQPDLYVRAPRVLVHRLLRFLTGRGVKAQVAVLSGASRREEEVLLALRGTPDGLLPLLRGLPRTRLYRRLHARLFVESGWTHPLDLAGCVGLLGGDAWLFFNADAGVDELPAGARFAPAADLALPKLTDAAGRALALDETEVLEPRSWPVRVVHRGAALGPVVARLLEGPKAHAWLTKMVYLAPTAELSRGRLVAWADHALVVGAAGASALPVGRPLRALSPRILCALDAAITPRISRDRLHALIAPEGEDRVLLLPNGSGWRWRADDEVPLARHVLADLNLVAVQPLASEADVPATLAPVDDSFLRLLAEPLR